MTCDSTCNFVMLQLSECILLLDYEFETFRCTPVHFAAKSNNMKALEILLKAGASYKANDKQGYSVCVLLIVLHEVAG